MQFYEWWVTFRLQSLKNYFAADGYWSDIHQIKEIQHLTILKYYHLM